MLNALTCENVTKIFRVQKHNGSGNGNGNGAGFWQRRIQFLQRSDFYAVRDVSLSIPRGEIFGVIGENGSGKSTLIRMISTLIYPTSGVISVFDQDVIRDFRRVRTMINRVSVEASFFKRLSARENLLFAGRLYGVKAATIIERVTELLGRVDFPLSKLNESMEDLSRGQQQKVAIVRALLTSPVLMLLDEPTTGLDPRSKLEVQECIREIRDSHDATVLLTTHDMNEAEKLCDRLVILDQGRIIAMDTPEGLRKRIAGEHPEKTTLEDVFLHLAGRRYNNEVTDDSE